MTSHIRLGLSRRAGITRGIFSITTGILLFALTSTIRAGDHMELRSDTFVDGATLPLIMIADFPASSGANSCTASGAAGGDESPELAWNHVPAETRSFVVIVYDVTASFTHWGMYNISADTRRLPLNAGVAGSSFGTQIANDFGDLSYDGPCPPATETPHAHEYRITLYALDVVLADLPTQGDFPPGAEALYHALIRADGHILESASLRGFYSAAK
jgi:Raf kinase inhibitor-like YbhB/YbcL family protein